MLTADQVRLLGVRAMRHETERDQQVRVGASNLSNPCDWHLAADLRGERTRPDWAEFGDEDRAWLGAKVGTGIHATLGWGLDQYQKDTPEAERDMLSEYRLKIGSINGYGDVFSTLDLATRSMNHLIDVKSTLRKKTQQFRAALGRKSAVKSPEVIAGAKVKLEQYQLQTHFYSDGLIKEGQPIDGNSILFINRDGTGWYDSEEYEEEFLNSDNNRDIWEWTYEYDPAIAEAGWARANRIYDDVMNGRRDFQRHKYCYVCKVSGVDFDAPDAGIVTMVKWEDL